MITHYWVFDDFLLAEKLFAKTLGSLETSVLTHDKYCGKLVSLLELSTTFDEKHKVTLVLYFTLI